MRNLRMVPIPGLLSIKQEIIITPVIVSIPILISLLFFFAFPPSLGNLVMGVTILIGNLVFDVPLLKSFVKIRKTTSRT